MKSTVLRTAFALSLTALLAACGVGNSVAIPVQTAALVPTVDGEAQPITTAATATMPAPDCAADACKGLRIIDANSEAYRYDAARRAAAEGNSQS